MKNYKSSIAIAIASCLSVIVLPSQAQITNPAPVPQPVTNPVTNPAPTVTTPAVATPQSGFLCDVSGEVPTTMYRSSQGSPEPWIQWVSDHFSGSGWSPDARCQEVSSRLETYRRNKKLRYVTLGTVNNQSVICVATKDQGPCEGIIYTLKPGQDGIQALNNLFAWRKGEQGLQSNYESVTAIPYIDVGTRLEETKVEQVEAEVAPTGSVPPATTTRETVSPQTPEITTPDKHRDL
ncbi:MAG: COP23 domain-containing protein [Cyanobacteria bacterium J06631_6]